MRWPLPLLGVLLAVPLTAMGFTEDPQEKLTKTYTFAAVKVLEIRGQVEFELIPGPQETVTVETSRALFDQLTVSNWWGNATVGIESGLRGPREQGYVKVRITLPSLDELDISDLSSGVVTWPGTSGKIRVAENSSAVLHLDGQSFEVDTSWKTQVSVQGRVSRLKVDLRHQSVINTQGLDAEDVVASLDENSTLQAGKVIQGSGLARHQSRVVTDDPDAWAKLVLREDSTKGSRVVRELPQ